MKLPYYLLSIFEQTKCIATVCALANNKKTASQSECESKISRKTTHIVCRNHNTRLREEDKDEVDESRKRRRPYCEKSRGGSRKARGEVRAGGEKKKKGGRRENGLEWVKVRRRGRRRG